MNADTRLSKALDAHPDVLELIVSLNPHDFARLRNPHMRRFMAPRITLRRVAAMAHLPAEELLERIHQLTGEPIDTAEPAAGVSTCPQERPDWLVGVDEEAIRWVDVTPQDDALEDPLPPIMAGWKQLQPGEVMGIKHRWEPQPLYDVWDKLGLEYWSRQVAPDLWHIFVHRPATPAQSHRNKI